MAINDVVIHAIDGMRKSAENLQAIQEAKRKRQQENELLQLSKQEAQIKLKKAAAEGKTTDLQNQILEQQMNEYFKQQETIQKGKEAEIKQVEGREQATFSQAGNFVKNIAQTPEGRSLVLQTINPALAPPREAFNDQGEQIMSYPGQQQAIQPQEAPIASPAPISTPTATPAPTATKSVFEERMKPRLQLGKDRMSFDRVEEKPKEFFLRRIQEKRANGQELTPEENILWKREILGQTETKEGGRGSAMLENARNKRTEDLIETLSTNKFNQESIDLARQAMKNIDSGVYGKVKRGLFNLTDPENPLYGDWQKIKMVLTDAQLLYTAKTKGAISDKEMNLFKDAAANDDIFKLYGAEEALNRLERFIGKQNKAKVDIYKRIYKEDPTEWDEIKALYGDEEPSEESNPPKTQGAKTYGGLTIQQAREQGYTGFDTDTNQWVK